MNLLLILSSLILCSVLGEDAENPVDVTSSACKFQRWSQNYGLYDFTISWIANPSDKLFLTYIDPSCVSQTNWCKNSCSILNSIDISGQRLNSQTYAASSKDSTNGFSRVAILHSYDNICKWASRYDPSYFKSTKTLVCQKAYSPSDSPNPVPNYRRPDYSLISLLLLLLPLLIRDAYRNRVAANDQYQVTETNVNNIPLYDMNTLPATQVQIFPEYPMMTTNTNSQFQGVDPTQTLTPVYTQTYSHPGIQ